MAMSSESKTVLLDFGGVMRSRDERTLRAVERDPENLEDFERWRSLGRKFSDPYSE